MLAAKGFAVLYCNPRGSSGYGLGHMKITKEVLMDLLTMTFSNLLMKHARRFDMIDEQRIGVTGGSYGGYMTNYMATHAKALQGICHAAKHLE